MFLPAQLRQNGTRALCIVSGQESTTLAKFAEAANQPKYKSLKSWRTMVQVLEHNDANGVHHKAMSIGKYIESVMQIGKKQRS